MFLDVFVSTDFHISSTVSTHTFQVKFQQTCFSHSFNTYILGAVSTQRFEVQFQQTRFSHSFPAHTSPKKNIKSQQTGTKVKALSEELEQPMNVARWRKLPGHDPTQEELINKVKAIQRRLIARTEDTVEKDLQIHDKEKHYVELKNVLAMQPSPKIAEQAGQYRATLQEQTNSMKALAAEINMYQASKNKQKDDENRLRRILHETKKSYFESKRLEELAKENLK